MTRKLLARFFPSKTPIKEVQAAIDKGEEIVRQADTDKTELDVQLEELRQNKHLFIFGLCGRSASTALQRILNSSNEVSIWGESWGAIDNLLQAYTELSRLHSTYANNGRAANVAIFRNSFRQKSHDQWYATAFKQIDSQLLLQLERSIINLLYDEEIGLKRFGYKDIGVYQSDTLEQLQQFFPAAQVIFIFRDPLKQWNSVKNAGYWPYSKDVHLFIEKYIATATYYFSFWEKFKEKTIFFENTNLKEEETIARLVSHLELSFFDSSLLHKKVNSTSAPDVDEKEQLVIMQSQAYQWYKKCQVIQFN